MSETSQIVIVGFGAAVAAVIMLFLFVEYYQEPTVASEPQKIYAQKIQQGYDRNLPFENFVKISDMEPASSLHFYYPNSQDTENRDAFQVFTLVRLPEYLGGAVNDTSAFRAYSALDITSHCLIKYWPHEPRDNRIEDPCQSYGYRILDGVSAHPHAKNLRGPSTGALPYLDLDVDEQGYLQVLPPTFTEDKNGVVGSGRLVSNQEIEQTSLIFLDVYSSRLPESTIIPFEMGGFTFHYASPTENPVFHYYDDLTPGKTISLEINTDNYCDVESWRPPKHGYAERFFGIDDKTIYYEIKDDETNRYYVYFDFCLDGKLYSIESNAQYEQISQIIVDTFLFKSNLE